MRIFLDTSALLKRYLEEKGSQEMEVLIEEASELIVSPTAWIESQSALTRLSREKGIDDKRYSIVKQEIKKDFNFFNHVLWSEALEEKAVDVVEQYRLKALDGIQLASGILSHPNLFITADKKLYSAAKREFKAVVGLGI